MMKQLDLKPNFSELSRIYNLDRHTIAKYYYKGGLPKTMNKNTYSYFDDYYDEIIEKMNIPAVNKTAVFRYLQNKYGQDKIKSFSTFCHYTRKLGIQKHKSSIPHVFYETPPASQLQVDWKENIVLTSKSGHEFCFNIFAATLGYSRMHFFIFSYSKTTEDFLRCLIDVFYMMGGLPKEILTDNMTALVSIRNGHKKKHQIIKQFEKDLHIKINLCKVRTPETKGKVESSNRFMNWLLPYDGEFDDEADLIRILSDLSSQCNLKVNETTSIPPITLFKQEKEYLKPIANRTLMDSYIDNIIVQTVPQTLLVQYDGSGYSVPPQYIHQKVKLIRIDNQLYIYDNTKLITVHELSHQKRNYKFDHYYDALKLSSPHKHDNDIRKMAEENLSRFDKLGGHYNET